MRLRFLIIASIIVLCALVAASALIANNGYRSMRNQSFSTGEVLEYKIHYGFINAGDATIEVNPKLYILNNRICYKIDILGRSTGTFDMMLRIRNRYTSYIDTAAFVPHKFYRHIQEGRYRKNESTAFDHKNDIALIKDEKDKQEKTVKIPNYVQDMVSGYYFLRLLDYSKMQVGDTIKVDAILESELYDFRIRYMGKDKVKTKFGTINSILLVPIMPDNKLFAGENSISVWLSDDKNKIPVKVKANMFVGAVELDLKNYRGVKNNINFTK